MTSAAVPAVDLNAPLASDTSETLTENENVTKSMGWFYAGSAVLLLVCAATVALGFLANAHRTAKVIETPAVIITEPVVAPKKFDRSIWKVAVLNGSGKAGQAGERAKKLEQLGYTVATIGNAEKRTTESVVFLSQDALKFQAEILQDLGLTNHEILLDSDVDIQLVIGSADVTP